MAFITNTGVNYDQPFVVESVDILLNGPYSSKDYSISASQYGLDASTPLVNAFLAQNNVELSWSVKRPVTLDIIDTYVSDAAFSGFYLNFYDSGRNFLVRTPNSFLETNYSINNSDLYSIFSNVTGSNSVQNLNQFFIDVISQDLQGKTSTGTFLINFGTHLFK